MRETPRAGRRARPRRARARAARDRAGDRARLHELVETGTIAELDELEREVRPELVGLGRLIGLGPKRMLEIAAALGVETADEFRAAALAGRLRDVRGHRAGHRAEGARPPAPRARGAAGAPRSLLPEARELVGSDRDGARRRDRRRPAPLGRRAEGARRRRRGRRARGRCSTRSSGCRRSSRSSSARSAARSALRSRACRSSSSSPSPARFGTELVRATGSRGVRRRARAAARTRPTRSALYAALGVPWCPPELREAPFARRAAARSSSSRTSAATCTATRRGRTARRRCSRWRSPRASSATSTSRSATTRRTSASCPGLDADALRRQAEEIAAANERARAVPDPARRRGRHPPRRLARPARRRARRARLGAAQPPRRPARGAAARSRARSPRRCAIRRCAASAIRPAG